MLRNAAIANILRVIVPKRKKVVHQAVMVHVMVDMMMDLDADYLGVLKPDSIVQAAVVAPPARAVRLFTQQPRKKKCSRASEMEFTLSMSCIVQC